MVTARDRRGAWSHCVPMRGRYVLQHAVVFRFRELVLPLFPDSHPYAHKNLEENFHSVTVEVRGQLWIVVLRESRGIEDEINKVENLGLHRCRVTPIFDPSNIKWFVQLGGFARYRQQAKFHARWGRSQWIIGLFCGAFGRGQELGRRWQEWEHTLCTHLSINRQFCCLFKRLSWSSLQKSLSVHEHSPTACSESCMYVQCYLYKRL